jgi:hypothetical protein
VKRVDKKTRRVEAAGFPTCSQHGGVGPAVILAISQLLTLHAVKVGVMPITVAMRIASYLRAIKCNPSGISQ